MKFNFATIHVKDLETSIRFYEEVIGMKMVRRFPAGPNMEIAFMAGAPEDEPGSAEIELICDKGLQGERRNKPASALCQKHIHIVAQLCKPAGYLRSFICCNTSCHSQ